MEPIIINGECNSAIAYAKAMDENCKSLVLQYLNHPLFAGTKVRIMPDMHFGREALVGFTATCNEYVIPSLIGVDIGCGINAYNLGKGNVACDKLDKYIRKHIPAGRVLHSSVCESFEAAYAHMTDHSMPLNVFKEKIGTISAKLKMPVERIWTSLGTLGSGNHFIEIDRDEDQCRWLLIHTGSRNFGLQVATYHQKLAQKKTPDESSIKFLSGAAAEEYIADMTFAQFYARVNRALIAYQIGCNFFKIACDRLMAIESIHNYIDFEHRVIRKGAISAQKDEPLVIPFSMADGAIIGKGKGNGDWNYSAPHGSGRKLSRTQAQALSLDQYRTQMSGIWSSCVNGNTLDESPMAYKSSKDILEFVTDTLSVTNRLRPIYNFKVDM
ncbi:MAG: RtcB family protein [Puniceicoccales bacterium]|jgi:RNA-splicing ligase RtcB|nr:RtcB family protein [Puniceicoccales bacterium]